jgi:phage shock protein C
MDETKRCTACFETIDARATRCPRCTQRQPGGPGLYRDVPGRLVGGVCAAVAQHFNWDLTLVRLVLVTAALGSGGLLAFVYSALWLLLPFERGGRSPGEQALAWVQKLFDAPGTGTNAPTGPQDL